MRVARQGAAPAPPTPDFAAVLLAVLRFIACQAVTALPAPGLCAS